MVVNCVCCIGIWQKLLWLPKQFGNCFLIRLCCSISHPWASNVWVYCHQLSLALCHSEEPSYFLPFWKSLLLGKSWASQNTGKQAQKASVRRGWNKSAAERKVMVGLAQQDSVDTGVCAFGAPAPEVATETHRTREKIFLAGTCTFLYTLGLY